MSHTIKPFEELNVLDDFLISAIAGDPDVGIPFCRALLSALLQKKIGKIRIVSQRAITAVLPELRGIRMDVEIEELQETPEKAPGMSIYDLEPHLQRDLNFPRHNRFYQAKIDSRNMKKGENDFSRLPDLYVLTITNFDVFGLGYMQYTMRNRCEEAPELEYEDGLRFLYFNTEGTKGGTPTIRALLKYLKESTEKNVTDEVTREIHEYVTDVKIRPEVKSEYMTFEEFVDAKARMAAKEAAAEAKKEAEEARKEAEEARKEAAEAKKEAEEVKKEAEEVRKEAEEVRKEAEETKKEATVQAIVDLLEDLGSVPEEVKDRLRKEGMDSLRKYLKLAAKAESLKEFTDKLENRG